MKKESKKNTLEVLKDLHEAYKAFLDSPTSKNINLFIQLSSMYTESWINDASNENITSKISSADLNKENFKESSAEINNPENESERLTISPTFPTKSITAAKYPLKIGSLIIKNEVGRAAGKTDLMRLITSSVYCPPLNELDGKDLHYM